jgi:hypothetical protein
MRSFFEGTRPGKAVRCGAEQFEMPVLYFRDDSFQAMFTADLQKLRAAMPSDRLQPIQVGSGRGLVAIAAFDYLETSVDPYGEIGIVVPAVYASKPPPLLPMLLESSWPGFGSVVLHLPVTRKLACDAGRLLWGYTKFVADMDFQNTPELHEVSLSEGNQHILTLRVMKRGIAFPDRRPVVTYSVKDRELVRTTIPQRAIARMALGAGGSSLVLGDTHPVARSIRELGIDTRPIVTRYFLERTAILPEGEIIERDVRPLDGYWGANRDRGELRVEHMVH